MRVLIIKSTGKIHEMQSDATEGTLLANAQTDGLDMNDCEEREMTQEEYGSAMRELARPELERASIKAQIRENAIEAVEAIANQDVVKIEEFKTKQAALRALLRE